MERRCECSVAREQLLHREEARLTLGAAVAPVSLERKFISMLSPPTDSPASIEASSTSSSTAMTSSTTVSTAPSVPATSATAVPRIGTTTPAVSAAAVSASTAAAARESTSIVGGKRPLGEESPVIILLQQLQQQQPQDDDQADTWSDVLESDSSSSQHRAEQQTAQEQSHLQQWKPEDATRTLSTQKRTSQRGRDPGRKRDTSAVHFSDVSPKRDVSHVMKFFQEQEKHLQDSFLSLPKRSHKSQRSPSPRLQQAAGLEHLDNLIRLMEQLTSLKDENSRLRKRCDFLESTKILLQAKRDLCLDSSSSSSGLMTLSPKHGHHHHHHHHPHDHLEHNNEKDIQPSNVDMLGLLPTGGRLARPRISSAEELEYLELADASSDQTPKKAKSAMHKRSFSTGSLEVPSEMTTEVGGVDTRKRKGKSQRRIFGKSSGSKQKSKGSKWARVKKVLTGQKIYEDLGTTIRTIRELGRSSHISYSGGAAQHVMSTSATQMSTANNWMSSTERQPIGGDYSRSRDNSGARAAHSVSPALLNESHLERLQDVEDADLTSEIWMGPPGWWREYQASRDTDATSTTSDVSSVIEVTTMYLGGKKETTTSATSTTTAPLLTTSINTSATTAKLSTVITQEAFLTIERPLARRQSSPSLVMSELAEEDDIVQELATSLEATRPLHKSASCKSADLDMRSVTESKQSKKSHRSAWGRVKDIIHTRKDSIKKKPKRGKSGLETEEPSELDVDILLEDHWSSDVFDDGLLGRSTPKSSPVVIRQQTTRGTIGSLPSGADGASKTSPSRLSTHAPDSSAGTLDVATLLAGSVSTEFNKKMQEWEELKRKKSSFRVSLDESDLGSLDMSTVSQQMPDTRELRATALEHTTEVVSRNQAMAVMEVSAGGSFNVEDMQRRMTDSFSRKMQEWERLKFKAVGAGREPSPDGEKKDSKSRKDDRQKSKRSREEKEKEKWERQREREMQKVEKEQVKLEKEKQRIEKERLRALEREAKLERLKGRLSQVDMEGSLRHPVVSPLSEYKVTADFARKLHEWELKKGLSHDVSNSIYLEAQKMSIQHLTRGGRIDRQAQQHESRYQPVEPGEQQGPHKAPAPPPLSLQPYWDSPESTSPVEKCSETSLADDDTCTSVTDECLTRSNISSLERANRELLDSLQKKEMEYAAVQEQVRKVNEKLASVRENHTTEMARFHRELARGHLLGPVNVQVEELETTVGDLEQRIHMMENVGDKLVSSMESAAIGKWQSIEGEETVHTQLVELVDQMRGMLAHASQSEEQSQKTTALSNFETLYTQAMKLQVQMNNLRLSHLERNREIMMIKRQLLLQEVNNLLLQADISRRETELYQLHEAKRFSSLRRWNTFSGAGRHRPDTQVELQSSSARSDQQQTASSRPSETPYINIPQITENVVLAGVASSSISAPSSPLYVTSGGECSTDLVQGAADRPLTYPGQAGEVSTDHVETHLLIPPTVTSRHRLQPAATAAAFSPHQPHQANTAASYGPGYEAMASLQLPRLAIHISPIQYPYEMSCAMQSEVTTAAATTTKATTTTQQIWPLSDTAITAPAAPTTTTITTTTRGDRGVETSSPERTDITTVYDSVPLHLQIEQLKREKRKVEKGPPTLKESKSERLSAAPSPGKVAHYPSSIEVPSPTIPKQRSLETTRLVRAAVIVHDDYSLAPSVMECTESLHILEQTDSELGAIAGGISLPAHASEVTHSLPPTSDLGTASSVSFGSPTSKHMLWPQREEREASAKDYRAISPQGSPVAGRGKPPLPRHAGGVSKQSPSSSCASDKGPRSKSVSDMEHRTTDSKMSTPLQDVINRFEKRATVCESDHHPIELRKTPSPTLHLPRVGLVSRVRRLKPAAELLEESQRYRSGHSVYSTRILQRYVARDEHKSDPSRAIQIKEQLSSGLLEATIQRLCQETTSVHSTRTNSHLPGTPTDSQQPQPELDVGLAKQRYSPSERVSPMEAVAVASGEQVAQVLMGRPASRSQERTLSDSDIDRQQGAPRSSTVKAHKRRSCEVAMILSSPTTSASEISFQTQSLKTVDSCAPSSQRTDSTLSPSSHQSLPAISPSSGAGDHVVSSENTARVRAATYCVPDVGSISAGGHSQAASTQLATISPSGRSQATSGATLSLPTHARTTTSAEKAQLSRRPSPISADSRGRGKMGTVGVLCKQSISFDLGVSLYSHTGQTQGSTAKSRQAHSWDPSHSADSRTVAPGQQQETAMADLSPAASKSSREEAGQGRSVPTSSEGEMASSSPTSEEKKSRGFLHSAWLQKSKQFFKVSK